jgi:hypothetical protein
LPNKTKPNSSRTDLRVYNEVEVNVAKGTEDNQEDNTRPDKRNKETGERTKERGKPEIRFLVYEKGPYMIHVKLMKPDNPNRKVKKWGKFYFLNLMSQSKTEYESIKQYSRFIWEVMITQRVEANGALNNHIIKDAGFRAYIPRYTIIK